MVLGIMRQENRLENKWLIKSENRILGPYNFEQVIDLIRKKQISIIDEIRDPETRWLYVRENGRVTWPNARRNCLPNCLLNGLLSCCPGHNPLHRHPQHFRRRQIRRQCRVAGRTSTRLQNEKVIQ